MTSRRQAVIDVARKRMKLIRSGRLFEVWELPGMWLQVSGNTWRVYRERDGALVANIATCHSDAFARGAWIMLSWAGLLPEKEDHAEVQAR